MTRHYTSEELADFLQISEEDFHREIKKLIKADFKQELKDMKIENPDILLDKEHMIYLADPRNHDIYYETEVNFYDYKEENDDEKE